MAPGPDSDEEDELVDIELEELPGEALVPPRAPPPGPPAVPSTAAPPAAVAPPRASEAGEAVPTAVGEGEGEVDLTDMVEVRQPIAEAAETDARADRTLFETEASAATDGARRAALLLEVARLVEAEG